jgi:hypothetical protein
VGPEVTALPRERPCVAFGERAGETLSTCYLKPHTGVSFAALAVVGLTGCNSTGPTDSLPRPLTRVDPDWVVGDAASRLQADGRLDLSYLIAPEGNDLGESAARTLATTVVRLVGTSAGNLRQTIEEEHGAGLDFAQSAVTVTNDGKFNIPGGSGNDFATYGIPLSGRWELSPEVAVQALVQAMPRKVKEIGEFTGCPYSIPPCLGGAGYVWHLYVDQPIRVRRNSDMVELDAAEFYVEASQNSDAPLLVMVPEAIQPPDQWLHGPFTGGPDSVWVARRGPVRFSTIDVIGQ